MKVRKIKWKGQTYYSFWSFFCSRFVNSLVKRWSEFYWWGAKPPPGEEPCIRVSSWIWKIALHPMPEYKAHSLQCTDFIHFIEGSPHFWYSAFRNTLPTLYRLFSGWVLFQDAVKANKNNYIASFNTFPFIY